MRILILILCVAVAATAQSWLPMDKALESAKAECKPAMIVVYSETCSACVLFFQKYNQSQLLASIGSEFALGRVSVEEAMSRYHVTVAKTPTIYFMDAQRNELMPEIQGTPSDMTELAEYMQKAAVIQELYGKCEETSSSGAPKRSE